MSAIKGNIVFHIGYVNFIGGVEQWIYYIAKKYSKDHDIVLLYNKGESIQIKRLQKLIKCVVYTGQDVECEKFIFSYDLSLVGKVKAKEYIYTIHADYKVQNIKAIIPKQTTQLYCVSELARKSFVETHEKQIKALGLECEVLYNPVALDKPKRVLRLISATRLTKEKGEARMKVLARELRKKNIPFIWMVFTNHDGKSEHDDFVYMSPRLDISGYIADADYLIQLSDTEGFSYSIVESLCLGTPVVVTDFPVATEMGIKDNKNGCILNMDMSNVDDVIDSMYTNTMKGFSYDKKQSDVLWNKILGRKSKSNYIYEEISIKVESLVEMLYKLENKKCKPGDKFIVESKERLAYLTGDNPAKKVYVKQVV